MMTDYRETGLPMNEPEVFKAFCAWRLNAKDFAEMSHEPETYPLEVAQLINKVNPAYTQLMKMALLTTVPEPAWGVMEKRFGAETVNKLDEMWKHVRTGYSYSEDACDDVKGLTMAAAIKSFDAFIKSVDNLGEVFSMAQIGGSPQEIVQKLQMPECKMFERLSGKLSGTAYPELEDLYNAKLGEYREARKQQTAQLAEMGMPFPDADDDAEALSVPFEMQGLTDAPEVRKAYEILTHDSRVGMGSLANAISVGRLLSELPDLKDPATIAAGMMDSGLARRTSTDAEFLAKKLPESVMDVLNNYDISAACLKSAEDIKEAPPAIRQLAVAKGVVLLDMARKQSEMVMEFIDMRSERLPPGVGEAMKAENMQPLKYLAAVIPKALEPIMNKTGSRQLEQIFDAQVKDLKQYVADHTPATDSQAMGNGGRIVFRSSPKGPDFGM